MAVFSENAIAVGTSPTINLHKQLEGTDGVNGVRRSTKIAFYVRPNAGVYYTRVAGALMTPLSNQEYADRVRVGDLGPLLS